MSKVLVDEANLTAIGNAIRAKNESSTKYKPSEMADAINNIVGSNGDDIEYLDRIELKNQYIDTGITPEPAYLYSYSFDASTSKDYIALFGCRKSDGNSKSFGILQLPTEGSIRLDFDDPDSNGTTTTVNAGSTLSHSIYRFYGNGTSLYASGLSGSATYTKKSISASTTSGLTASIYLGAYHRQDNNSAIFTNPDLKIYGFKITNSDTIIGNFIPASCNGVKGMYETVKNQFHGVDGTITPVNVTSVSTTGDIKVVSSDSWKTTITQSDHQTITLESVSSEVINSNSTYSSALKFLFSISTDTGYIPGTMLRSADNVKHVYNVSASPAEEIAGMIENGWAKVYEDGKTFYSDENYKTMLTSLSGDIVIAGMKNTDVSGFIFNGTHLYNNTNLTKFKNTFIIKAGGSFLRDCMSLTSANLSNLTSAEDYLLADCTSLTSVDLPNLTSAGNDLLSDCYKLQSIYLRSTTMCTLGGSMYLPSSASIYVPASLIDSYKTASNWSSHADNFKTLESIQLSKISIIGLSKINMYGGNTTGTYKIKYNDGAVLPEQSGVTWSITGNATISQDGIVTLNNANVGDALTITATSTYNSSISTSLTVSVVNIQINMSIDLNNGQWVDSGTTVDGHTVYKSDAGSYNVNNGTSTCTVTVQGYNKVTVYARSCAESNYDYTEVGPLDGTVSRDSSSNVLSTKGKQSDTQYYSYTFTITDNDQHTFQVLYSKDSSGASGDDRGYFYVVAE